MQDWNQSFTFSSARGWLHVFSWSFFIPITRLEYFNFGFTTLTKDTYTEVDHSYKENKRQTSQ